MIDRRSLLRVLVAAGCWLLCPSPARAVDLPPATERALQSSDYIYVATRRKSGARSSVEPIWFYYLGGGKLFFTTSPESWKAKRIGRGSPLYIWVGSKDGPFLIGDPKEVSDASLIDHMGKAYADKYWIAWLGFFKPRSARVREGKTKAYLVSLRPGQPPPVSPE
jgi:hypothetical protein